MKKYIIILFITALFFACTQKSINLNESPDDLVYDSLANRWDEAIPLGNGILGALIWKNGEKLRISLDRADLWDLRPMKNLDLPEWKFKWVYDQWKNKTYKNVQDNFDAPYDQMPAPTKIPAGALEIDIKPLGKLKNVRLYVKHGVCKVEWESGASLSLFVHAEQPFGSFHFENIDDDLEVTLIPPPYNLEKESGSESPVTGQDLRRLEYTKGIVERVDNSITYNQNGWGDFKYEIFTKWKREDNNQSGIWSISSEYRDWPKTSNASAVVNNIIEKQYFDLLKSHTDWWKNYWDKSNITIPDATLQKQWYLEMYKFGSAARNGAPPISLQAVWTADNGRIPPWKGDFHHDLNTQLSYWPAYIGNHLDLEEGFVSWLWKYKPTFEKYTRDYYETNGLNVPGVTTLIGEPMGGWIQYSFGPTVSAWLGQHFYLHWKYSLDRNFLKEKAYPWLKAVAIHLDELSVFDEESGLRKLPISSSPEVNDNSRDAWFKEITNFDLSLIRWTFSKAEELAEELGFTDEAKKWRDILAQWPNLAVDENEGLKFSTKMHYHQSHRHFSHLMAFHPLGLIDWAQGEKSQQIITNTLNNLEKQGSDWWTGYSFSWLGNLYARAFEGDKAVEVLKTFAECFCLKNSFHVNGDQCKAGHSKFLYRPFTLEGNFAYASGILEMLLQSHTGIVKIFPAIPKAWRDLSFNNLRTVGAFLISAEMKNGIVTFVNIKSEKGGTLLMNNPFLSNKFMTNKKVIENGKVLSINFEKGEIINLRVEK